MEWVSKIGCFFLKSLAFLPCFFTITNYFTVLKPEQRTETIGWLFLIVSVLYFALGLILLVKNW